MIDTDLYLTCNLYKELDFTFFPSAYQIEECILLFNENYYILSSELRNMLNKQLIGLTFILYSCLITSCQQSTNNFTRKDCQSGSGYNGYLRGYYIAKNYLQRTAVNRNEVYGYCYMQGYFDALE